MSNIIKLPGPNSRARKKFAIKRAKERYAHLVAKMETEMPAWSDFSDIRTQSDLVALASSDPFRYMQYMAAVAT